MSEQPASRMGLLRLLLLLCAGALIFAWQYSFFFCRALENSPYRISGSHGVGWGPQEYLYFNYYHSLFPIGTRYQPLVYDQAGAKRILEEFPEKHFIEYGQTVRRGQLLTAYLFLFDAWRTGSPEKPNLRFLHALLFSVTLCALLYSFVRLGRPVLGALMVLLFGSNEFQLVEIYQRQNVFSWPILVCLMLLALNAPFLSKRKQGSPIRILGICVLLSGLLLGTVGHIRPEAVIVGSGVLLLYCFSTILTAPRKIFFMLLLLLVAVCTHTAWSVFFNYKIEQAVQTLHALGGTPEMPATLSFHAVWHPILLGLGDFDRTYGYRWKDEDGYRYAVPQLEERYGKKFYWDKVSKRPYLQLVDSDGNSFHMPPELLPEYEEIIKGKLLGAILGDPLWYAEILVKRAFRMFSERSPLRLGVADTSVQVSIPGLVLLVGVAVLLWRREREELLLCGMVLPLSATGLLVYSGGGNTHYTLLHFMVLALLGAFLIRLLWERRGTVARRMISGGRAGVPVSHGFFGLLRRYVYAVRTIVPSLQLFDNPWEVLTHLLGLNRSVLIAYRLKNGMEFEVLNNKANRPTFVTFYEIFAERCYPIPDELHHHRGKPIIFDVGAQAGLFSFFAAEALPNAEIFAFEPERENAFQFEHNIAKQAELAKRIHFQQQAIWQYEGTLLLHCDAKSARAHSAMLTRDDQQRTPCTTLPSALGKSGCGYINLLKIDVEGAEYPLLYNTSEEFLRRVQFLYVEAHDLSDLNPTFTAARLCAFLTEHNFEALPSSAEVLHFRNTCFLPELK